MSKNRHISIVGIARIEKPQNYGITDFDPMHTRAGISTSDIHFIISKTVSAVRAYATEVPMSKHKSSSTNGLPATGTNSTKVDYYIVRSSVSIVLSVCHS